MSARSSLSWLLAPFTSMGREFTDLVRNPTAFLGGLAGSTVCMAGALALALLGTSVGAPEEPIDDEIDIVFLAGIVARKGVIAEPEPIPVKPVVDAQRVDDSAPPPTTTTDPDAPPTPTKPPAKDPPKKPVKDPVDPNQQGKPSDHNTDGNNPYHGPANAEDLPGDPFGSPDGWSEMAKDGDPWATAVLAALNNLTVGSYAGMGQDVVYKFQLIICADGRIDDVRTRGSTGKSDFDGQLRNALERIKLPKAPPDIAKQLAGGCKKIPYVFTWSGKQKHVE